MQLGRLAQLIQYHYRARQRTRQLAGRLLHEAEEADVATAEVDPGTSADDVAADDDATPDQLQDALATGFRSLADAILGKVFEGGMSWADAKPKFDKLFDTFEELTGTETGAEDPEPGAVAESVRERPVGRGARRLAEALHGGSTADAAARNRAFLSKVTDPH